MVISPAFLSSLIVEPIRYFYQNYAPADLKWSADIKESYIEIDTINNYNKVAVQFKPRILVSRGEYNLTATGLSDNLAEGKAWRQNIGNLGSKNNVKMLLAQGVAQILIEGRNEGTCEKMLDLTSTFLAQTSEFLADTYGFKKFGLPMAISSCTPTKDSTEIFQSTINLPWAKEVIWRNWSEDIKLKAFLLNVVPAP